jgi:hypothetical protein
LLLHQARREFLLNCYKLCCLLLVEDRTRSAIYSFEIKFELSILKPWSLISLNQKKVLDKKGRVSAALACWYALTQRIQISEIVEFGPLNLLLSFEDKVAFQYFGVLDHRGMQGDLSFDGLSINDVAQNY